MPYGGGGTYSNCSLCVCCVFILMLVGWPAKAFVEFQGTCIFQVFIMRLLCVCCRLIRRLAKAFMVWVNPLCYFPTHNIGAKHATKHFQLALIVHPSMEDEE